MATISAGPGVTYDPDQGAGQPGGAAGPLNPDGTLPDSQIHFGSPGDPAGPLDGSGKIPSSQLPPLDHDVGEAISQAAMLALPVSAPAICIRTDFTPAHVFYLTADPATTLANWVDTGEFGGGAANPTAQVGLTAVNGVLSTYMRSDAAPAISQGIAPTWTGAHQFAGVSTQTTPSLQVSNTNPQVDISLSSGAADAKRWNLIAGINVLSLRALNDSGSAGSTFWTATRTAGVATSWEYFVPLSVVQNVAAVKQRWMMKAPGTQNDAPATFGIASTYLGVGGGEWNLNSYRLIGFGYVNGSADQYPAVIGYQETQTSTSTRGDLVFGTRPTNTNVAPPINLRIRSDGQLLAEQPSYVPTTALSLATKGYVDSAASSGTYSPTFTAVANNNAPAMPGGSTWFYSQVGKKVTVSGAVIVEPTSSPANVQVGITLPVALTTTASYQIVGSGVSVINGTSVDTTGSVFATTLPGENRATLLLTVGDTQLRSVNVTYSYMLP